ncbi:neutral/alkaline non-lysosomal ceramidase N-terminal domain-containing protein [Cryptosporangium aurantiacum]|uniref:Neutral ceramidase n=1 Tax=Cryptosporangium aurantiacum TaxID=134849 RepID=A0A1M7RH90_9ACTN|nr:neutral/alkaline non-lysosomal ceramidase N-terminal domain-containing protein [Cryptosporangium aurantiacum]SHN45519.1 neutral ceramidase [Cryptosporangium aurantiacum]
MTQALEPFLTAATSRAAFTVASPPPEPLEPVSGLLAGAAEVDLTPPPGLPKAGYSRNARTGIGFRGRLRARILHLRAGTASVAIVQCDLLGGSAVVQRLVASAIRAETDVPLAGLFIGATHTHGAPGQFLGTDLYNGFASNRPGFDPAWTNFLVEEVSAGVKRAVASRQPARLALGSTEVWGLTRNRSLAAHVRNEDRVDRRIAAQRTYASVDPRLSLLRVDALGGGSLAALVVFGVHGTGIPMRNSVYNADLWAYVYEELQERLGPEPIVGALQGTHADVAPALRPGRAGDVEAARVGRGIGAAAAALHESLGASLREDVELGAGLREVDLSASSSIEGVTLPARPALGAALIAGAYENETPVVHRIPPFRAGVPKPHKPADPHGAKWVIGSRWLQPVVMPLRRFPRVLPVQVLRIGSALLVGAPFEITVDAGRRVASAVAASSGADDVIVSSVANEYAGYCTTSEEYARQHYEGGHTLYGPQTNAFLAAHAASLASSVRPGAVVSEIIEERTFDLRAHQYWPSPSGTTAPGAARPAGPARFIDVTAEQDAYWEQGWYDAAPGDLTWNQPIVHVEWTPSGENAWQTLVDDSSCALEVRYAGEASADHRYVVRWHAPELRDGREYRFVVRGLPLRPFN